MVDYRLELFRSGIDHSEWNVKPQRFKLALVYTLKKLLNQGDLVNHHISNENERLGLGEMGRGENVTHCFPFPIRKLQE